MESVTMGHLGASESYVPIAKSRVAIPMEKNGYESVTRVAYT